MFLTPNPYLPLPPLTPRRRWTRTRIPTAASIDERFRPLSVFWDVKALSNGTRRVDLRSGLQVMTIPPDTAP